MAIHPTDKSVGFLAKRFVTVGRKPQKVFKQDAGWVMKNLMNKKERRALTAPARRARR